MITMISTFLIKKCSGHAYLIVVNNLKASKEKHDKKEKVKFFYSLTLRYFSLCIRIWNSGISKRTLYKQFILPRSIMMEQSTGFLPSTGGERDQNHKMESSRIPGCCITLI